MIFVYAYINDKNYVSLNPRIRLNFVILLIYNTELYFNVQHIESKSRQAVGLDFTRVGASNTITRKKRMKYYITLDINFMH